SQPARTETKPKAKAPSTKTADRLTDDPGVTEGLMLPEERAFVVKNSDIMGRSPSNSSSTTFNSIAYASTFCDEGSAARYGAGSGRYGGGSVKKWKWFCQRDRRGSDDDVEMDMAVGEDEKVPAASVAEAATGGCRVLRCVKEWWWAGIGVRRRWHTGKGADSNDGCGGGGSVCSGETRV
ncbi:Protein of unknown function, partial [Gryllus bimaculatus]